MLVCKYQEPPESETNIKFVYNKTKPSKYLWLFVNTINCESRIHNLWLRVKNLEILSFIHLYYINVQNLSISN